MADVLDGKLYFGWDKEMLTLFLKANIRLFILDLRRTEAISDLFPLLAEKFESEGWQRLQTSHIKEKWITESFRSVDLICNIICYVVYFSLTGKSNS